MLRRCPSPTKSWNAAMKVGSEGLAARAHRFPPGHADVMKATEKVMDSNILGPVPIILPIRTQGTESMTPTNRFSHGKGGNALAVRRSSSETPKAPPTRVCKSRKSKDIAMSKLLTGHGSKAKGAFKSVEIIAADTKAQIQSAIANPTKIKLETEASDETDGSEFSGDFEPEEILSTKVRGGIRKYLVQWVGRPSSDSSWERKEHLYYSQSLIDQFHAARGDKP